MRKLLDGRTFGGNDAVVKLQTQVVGRSGNINRMPGLFFDLIGF